MQLTRSSSTSASRPNTNAAARAIRGGLPREHSCGATICQCPICTYASIFRDSSRMHDKHAVSLTYLLDLFCSHVLRIGCVVPARASRNPSDTSFTGSGPKLLHNLTSSSLLSLNSLLLALTMPHWHRASGGPPPSSKMSFSQAAWHTSSNVHNLCSPRDLAAPK